MRWRWLLRGEQGGAACLRGALQALEGVLGRDFLQPLWHHAVEPALRRRDRQLETDRDECEAVPFDITRDRPSLSFDITRDRPSLPPS